MINSLLILLRTIQRRPVVFGLNILGLSIGICCVFFITIYSIDELSFDKHFKNHDRIYRVVTDYQTNSGSNLSMAESFLGVAPTLKTEFAEVEEAMRVLPYKGSIAIQYSGGNNRVFDAENTYRADKEFFRVFQHTFLYGDKFSLEKPNSIVVSESLAKRLFGENTDQIKAVLVDNQAYEVTGVFNDLPRNSDLYYDAMLSHDFSFYDDDWGNPAGFTYVLLKGSADLPGLEAGINKVATRKAFSFFGKAYEMKSNIRISLQPLTDIHFSKPLSGDNAKGNPMYLQVIMTLGLLIFGIAILNHSNFSTSLYVERVHELSVRKLMGVNKRQLIEQFFCESGFVAGMVLFISIALFAAFLPVINVMIGKNLSFLNLLEGDALIIFLATFLLVVLAGNFYPVFYSFKTTTIAGLRGFSNPGKSRLRKILVAGQLIITTGLVFFTIIVHNQLDFLKTRDLGFNGNKVIMVSLADDVAGSSQMTAFIHDLKINNSIKEVSLINDLSYPGSERLGYQLGWIYHDQKRVEATFNVYEVDSLFTTVLAMKFLAGTNFTGQANRSIPRAIVNEAFVKMAGFNDHENIVGETIHAFDDKLKITGVVADFNYQGFQQAVKPLVMTPVEQRSLAAGKLLIALNSIDGLRSVQESYQKLGQRKPFEYSFLDEQVKKMFEQEQTTGQIAEIFSLLAIFLAAIGLHSLSALILVQRTKELVMRRILGITTGALVVLVSKEFFLLSLIAFAISIPLAWMQSQMWLSDFAFKTDMSIGTIGFTGLIVLAILILGILANVLRGASVNPVDSIRRG